MTDAAHIPLFAGAMLIVDHPVMMDRYALARVYGTPTAARMQVQYFDLRALDWSPGHKRRDRGCIRRHVRPDADPARVANALVRAHTAFQNATTAARKQYGERIDAIASI